MTMADIEKDTSPLFILNMTDRRFSAVHCKSGNMMVLPLGSFVFNHLLTVMSFMSNLYDFLSFANHTRKLSEESW